MYEATMGVLRCAADERASLSVCHAERSEASMRSKHGPAARPWIPRFAPMNALFVILRLGEESSRIFAALPRDEAHTGFLASLGMTEAFSVHRPVPRNLLGGWLGVAERHDEIGRRARSDRPSFYSTGPSRARPDGSGRSPIRSRSRRRAASPSARRVPWQTGLRRP